MQVPANPSGIYLAKRLMDRELFFKIFHNFRPSCRGTVIYKQISVIRDVIYPTRLREDLDLNRKTRFLNVEPLYNDYNNIL